MLNEKHALSSVCLFICVCVCVLYVHVLKLLYSRRNVRYNTWSWFIIGATNKSFWYLRSQLLSLSFFYLDYILSWKIISTLDLKILQVCHNCRRSKRHNRESEEQTRVLSIPLPLSLRKILYAHVSMQFWHYTMCEHVCVLIISFILCADIRALARIHVCFMYERLRE